MKHLFCILALLLSFGAQAQQLSPARIKKAEAAVRADIIQRTSARKVLYQPGAFQTTPYANPEHTPSFAGSTMVVHQFQTKDSTGFIKPYKVAYLVTRAGKVYMQEVFNPRR